MEIAKFDKCLLFIVGQIGNKFWLNCAHFDKSMKFGT